MPHVDVEFLVPSRPGSWGGGTTLTPADRAEVMRLAQGFACKDSAAAAAIPPETIRARRKRICRKLEVPGAGKLIASLLASSLRMLASGE